LAGEICIFPGEIPKKSSQVTILLVKSIEITIFAGKIHDFEW